MVKKVQNNKSDKVEDLNIETLEVPTVLSLLENDDNVMSDIQKDILGDEIEELPPIKEGQLNVSGIYVYDLGEKLEVKAYIRNGFSKEVSLDDVPLVIYNSKKEMLAYQIFDLKSIGAIPPKGARPVKVYFEKKNVYVENIPMDDWSIGFDTSIKASKRVKVNYEKLPRTIEVQDKLVLDNFLKNLPDINEGEFVISTFSIGIQKDGNIIVTVVMRNGNTEAIALNKLPVSVIDANGNVVKSNLFKLENFEVGALKARIFNFAFPTNFKLEKDVALDDWKIEFALKEVAKQPLNKEQNTEN
ncbi:SLAP domain-containing protein [Clostridium drakei]|uniref:SLAP domain-containing protein n=1 Tax=Clostridium drakei TaxID=332101 RepID=A0A2U8DKN7_9CLOT|nr:SLAP domain-containing protein [Clostridium drakei]AWI03148.1 SLAP domain-containing protein [Clostridium drakei]